MLHLIFRRPIVVRLTVLQLAVLTVCGCGTATKPQGKISGTVKYKGQPVTAGDVNLFQKATGAAATVPLDGTGKFIVTTPMETGTYSIAITPPRPKQLPPGSPPEKPAVFMVPIKFQDIAQSNLTKDIAKGDNVLDIVIPD